MVDKQEPEAAPVSADETKSTQFNTKQELMNDEDKEMLMNVYNWSMEQVQKESSRLKKEGVSPIEIKVLDMSVLVEGSKKQLNRVVFDTQLNFDIVENIMISPATACPFKAGYQYVNILLFGKDKP